MEINLHSPRSIGKPVLQLNCLQSNGQMEQMNQSLENTLHWVAARHPTAWSTFLHWVKYAQNSVTGVSPFMAATGFHGQPAGSQ